jgi:hypothetical protein
MLRKRAVGTPLTVKNGRYTGKIILPLNIGQGKVERLRRFLDGSEEIGLAASYQEQEKERLKCTTQVLETEIAYLPLFWAQ